MMTKLCSGKETLYKTQSKGNNSKRNNVELSSCALHFKPLPETCIPSLESFGPMMTKLCSGQEKQDDADDVTAAAD